MRREFVRVIDTFREPAENEFFFGQDPKNNSHIKLMLNYLEDNFGFRLKEIEPWKIKTTKDHHPNAFDPVKFGYRIVRTDES